MYRLYQYNDNDFRIICTKNDFIKEKKQKSDNDYYIPQDDSEIDRISISRSRRMIREYSLCNDFKYFFTSTVNSQFCDRFSLDNTQEKIRKIMKSIKRKNKDFIYLFITEKHKNGAFHFHGLCNDTTDLYINDNGYLSSVSFDKLGYNSFSMIHDKTRCSNYIMKYITKNCIKNDKGSVYFCSRGLKTARVYDIKPIDLDKFNKKLFQNDFVKICDFSLNNSNKEQLLYMQYNIQDKETFLKEFLNKCRNI